MQTFLAIALTSAIVLGYAFIKWYLLTLSMSGRKAQWPFKPKNTPPKT